MKLLYEIGGEKHIIITDNEDPTLGEVVEAFYRVMLSAGYPSEAFTKILQANNED